MVLNMNSVRRKLERLPRGELRKIERKLDKAIQGNYNTIGMLRRRTYDAYKSIKTMGRLGHRVRWIIGKRKGISCPALIQKEVEIGRDYDKPVRKYQKFGCGCETYHYYKTSYNFFHRCARCHRGKKEAYKEMVFNGVFQEKGQY